MGWGLVFVWMGGGEIDRDVSITTILSQVAQVAAKTLGIPIEMIKVKPSMTLTNPNGITTGGSITSELNCFVSYYPSIKV